MIFDWRKNSAKVVRHRRLSEGDDWEARRKWSQELALMRYVRHDLGWEEASARSFWESLPNGTFAIFSRYPLRDPAPVFAAMWSKAGSLGRLPEIMRGEITEGDLSALNSLPAPLPVRRFWLLKAAWIRSCEASGIPALYDVSVESWLWSRANPGKPFKRAHAKLREWSLLCGLPIPMVAPFPGGKPACYAAWMPGGKVVDVSYPWELPKRALSLLEKGAFVCPACGNTYERSPKANLQSK